MRFPASGRIRLAALVVVVLGFAAGGIAYANIPDSTTGVIHGCYKTGKGNLRVIDPSTGGACAGTETPLDWPGGPSDAYTKFGSTRVPGDSSTVTVASMSLPVGRFVLSATVTAAAGNATNIATVVTCGFTDGIFGGGLTYVEPSFHVTMPILGALTRSPSSPATVDLICRASGNDVSVDSLMIATQVGTIHFLG